MRISEPAAADRTLADAVSRAAAVAPERSAIVAGELSLSYREVMERAREVAAALGELGVRAGVPVASVLPRGAALAPAILGIWLAGGVYLPVDLDGPEARNAFTVTDSGARVALISEGGPGDLPDVIEATVGLDAAGAVTRQETPPRDALRPVAGAGPRDLAYIMYTSGTTGRPKGVMISHANLLAVARGYENAVYGQLGAGIRRVALNNPVTADTFFADFVNLAYGRTLYVVGSDSRRDPEKLIRLLAAHGVEVLDATPTQLRGILLAGGAAALDSLAAVITGGEATSEDLWAQIRDLPRAQAFNLYGPTECTVAVTGTSFGPHNSPVIGTELDGCGVWILDDRLRPVPDGQVGEIFITGDQVGLGYLNDPVLTSEKFLTLELEPGHPARGYRTGDRAWRRGDGQFVFVGRVDDQVSIAGYRVELGEVEGRVRECPGVRRAAVGMRQTAAGPVLSAWVVLAGGSTLDHVRCVLAGQLPGHMIPALHAADHIPMGPTGKADLDQLAAAGGGEQPAQDGAAAAAGTGEAAGTGDAGRVRALVRREWSEILGVPVDGEDDNFFALGGDSLKATKVVVALRKQVDSALPIRILFEHSGFGEFCDAITGHARGR